jgi:BirA family transcriptional regulator, biotin operon repressor / biotin---[acetyl-CoA-carboxylase] ligase
VALSSSLKHAIKLLADGHFHSGSELAEALGISRSAISKQLQTLAAYGLELTAISGKGYRLARPLQLLSRQQIDQHLQPAVANLLVNIEIHDLIASTNSHLIQQAQQTEVSAIACFAEFQSAGKGRRGRDWISPYGSNIYLSVLWRYQAGPGALVGLSLAVGVAVVKALQNIGIADVGLKWPNDIYWQNKKLAGILIEVSGETGGPCYAVIGLGLNGYISGLAGAVIDQAWTDLDSILGRPSHDLRNQLAAELLNEMIPVLAGFDQQGLTEYLQEWRQMDCMQGQKVDVQFGQQVIRGTVVGIDDQGMLLVREEGSQRLKTFGSGEVSLRKS